MVYYINIAKLEKQPNRGNREAGYRHLFRTDEYSYFEIQPIYDELKKKFPEPTYHCDISGSRSDEGVEIGSKDDLINYREDN